MRSLKESLNDGTRSDRMASFLSVQAWAVADVELAKTVIELLEPLLSAVRANRRISGDLEISAVVNALYGARIANDHRVLSECSAWLFRHVPVPLIVAELCLRSIVKKTPEGLPSRLRIEHQGRAVQALDSGGRAGSRYLQTTAAGL